MPAWQSVPAPVGALAEILPPPGRLHVLILGAFDQGHRLRFELDAFDISGSTLAMCPLKLLLPPTC